MKPERRTPSRLDWIIFVAVLVALAWFAAAHSAEARAHPRHGAPRLSLAACEAKEVAAYAWMGPDDRDAPEPTFHARDWQVHMMQEQNCHGDPNRTQNFVPDRVVTFTAKVYYDGSVQGAVRE